MDNKNGVRFRIKADKHSPGLWSFGVCVSHMTDETYLYINLFKWSISIGLLYEDWV